MEQRVSKTGDKLQPVKIVAKCVADFKTQWSHVQSAMARKLPDFQRGPETDKAAVLVGSGPTVAEFPDEIRQHKKNGHLIIAVKGGHDFLLEHDIVPHYALMVDPQPHIVKYFQRKQRPIKYLIASQVHPDVFDYFADQDCILWHLYSKQMYEAAIENGLHIGLMGGGSTSGLRGIVVAYMMGYRMLHLYGFDSCLSNNIEKISGEGPKNDKTISVFLGDREFICGTAMASQANEFLDVVKVLPGLKVKGHGDGLIQAIIRTAAAEGNEQCLP